MSLEQVSPTPTHGRIERQDEELALLVLTGEIDLAAVPELAPLERRLTTRPSRRVVVDCRQVTFMDSSGLGWLCRLRALLGRPDCLVLRGPCPQVRRVLELTGLTATLPIVDHEL